MGKLIAVAAAFATILGGIGDAAAQTYPVRPITMIVPLATGGSTDVIGRIVAEGMRAITSVEPPVASGTIMVTGRDG